MRGLYRLEQEHRRWREGAAVAGGGSTIEVCNNSGDGECVDVWDTPFENRYYYIYAEADDGSYGGDYFFCTLEDAFEIVDTQCSADYERKGFLQIDMSEGNRMQTGHTVSLDP
ncbi:MAG: DUF1036 domain-containing protein [Alphaproteobacteria bacterium]